MKVPALDLQAQYKSIEEEVMDAVRGVFESQHFILGPVVADFEKEVAASIGAAHALGVSSGTDALLIALMALDIGPGDEVITSPYTFFATAGVIARLQARPVFVDIDPLTYNLDVGMVEAAITENTKALLPIHLFGQCADMDPLLEVANRRGLAVVEDAAQSLHATYRGRQAGTMGNMGCFSFYPTKNLGGAGEGGVVVTMDPELMEKLARLRNHGMHPRNVHSLIGGNFRMDALQGAVLRVKLKHLPQWNARRREIARFYDEALAGTPGIVAPTVLPGNEMVCHQYVIRVPHRDTVYAELEAVGIGVAIYYPVALHLQECFHCLGYGEGDFPEAERAARETLALPIHAELTGAQVEYVAEKTKSAVETAQ